MSGRGSLLVPSSLGRRGDSGSLSQNICYNTDFFVGFLTDENVLQSSSWCMCGLEVSRCFTELFSCRIIALKGQRVDSRCTCTNKHIMLFHLRFYYSTLPDYNLFKWTEMTQETRFVKILRTNELMCIY